MKVIKRNNTEEKLLLDKITKRISNLSFGLNVDPSIITLQVSNSIYDGIHTKEIDTLTAEICAYKTQENYDYNILGGRILVSNLHKETDPKTESVWLEYSGDEEPSNVFNYFESVKNIDFDLDYSLDFNYDYFAFKTLERSYLLKKNGKVIERPQQLLLRVAIAVCKGENFKSTYNLLSNGYYTHASPTMFNASLKNGQLSSCFLTRINNDSLDSIYQTLGRCANISKYAGGIGLDITKVRSKNSYIKGTNGESTGIVPMLRLFNETARYVNQGGKRNGSIAVYIEPWHADIEDFLMLKRNTGDENKRARDLFYSLWVPDLFMERVKENKTWTLFDPAKVPHLIDTCGETFNQYYEYYEKLNLGKQIFARDLWKQIIDSQIETGTPYLLYKDSCNLKSNQQHIGYISNSNLCTEIIQYSNDEEIAVCNLASIALPKFVKNGTFDFTSLGMVVKHMVEKLNNVIDVTFYPNEESKKSNFDHRPIGIGVQGLADVFILLNLPFDSIQARQLNEKIFACIYYMALRKSNELAIERNTTFKNFYDSPLGKGLFQFDLWGEKPHPDFDWEDLRSDILKYGVLNSLLTTVMPTASTAQILGNNECIEPFTSNLYTRRVLSGEFICVNKHLQKQLGNKWNSELINNLKKNRGSIQHAPVAKEIKEIYKTVWEISQRVLIDMAADRGKYICQSQSLNLFIESPNISKLTSMHFYAWEKGLKTGIYYLRTKPKSNPTQFTVVECAENCESCSA